MERMRQVLEIARGELRQAFDAPSTYFLGGSFVFWCFCFVRILLAFKGEGLSPTGVDVVGALGVGDRVGTLPAEAVTLLAASYLGLPLVAVLLVRERVSRALRERRLRYVLVRTGRTRLFAGLLLACSVVMSAIVAAGHGVALLDLAHRGAAAPAGVVLFSLAIATLYGSLLTSLGLLGAIALRGAWLAFVLGVGAALLALASTDSPAGAVLSVLHHLPRLWDGGAVRWAAALAPYALLSLTLAAAGAAGMRRIDL